MLDLNENSFTAAEVAALAPGLGGLPAGCSVKLKRNAIDDAAAAALLRHLKGLLSDLQLHAEQVSVPLWRQLSETCNANRAWRLAPVPGAEWVHHY